MLVETGIVALDLEGEQYAAQRWRMDTDDLFTRASWALFAVAELHAGIAQLSIALEAADCSASEPEGLSVEEMSVLSSLLEDVTRELPGAVARADGLLRERLRTLDAAPTPAWRSARTRGPSDSLLERVKLYAAVPWAAFESESQPAEDAAAAEAQFPVLPATPQGAVSKAIVLLASTGAQVLSDDGWVHRDAASNWMDALREAEPLIFGSLPRNETGAVLSMLHLTQSDISAAMTWLSQAYRQSGAALVAQPFEKDGATALLGLRGLGAAGLDAYPYLITEGRASLRDGEAALAGRGLYHSLALAGRLASHAAQRPDLSTQTAARFKGIARAHDVALARVCTSRVADTTLRRLALSGAGDAPLSPERYQLLRGRDAAECVLGARRNCAPPGEASSNWVPEQDAWVVEADPGTSKSTELYFVDMQSEPEPALVAGLSLAPLDASEEERCHLIPLDAALHRALSKVHRDNVLEALEPPTDLPNSLIDLTLSASTPTPRLWGYELLLQNGNIAETLALGHGLSARRSQIEEALIADCTLPAWTDSCRGPGLVHAYRAACLAEQLRVQTTSATGQLRLSPEDSKGRASLSAWAVEAQQRALVQLARALPELQCEGEHSLLRALWQRLLDGHGELLTNSQALRRELSEAFGHQYDAQTALAARLLQARGLVGSQLALARLYLAVPFGLFEVSSEDSLADPLAGALERFPVLAFPAAQAEDAYAENLLRRAGLYPLLSAASSSGLDGVELAQSYASGALALNLRSLLLQQAPAMYGGLPTEAAAFLDALGISQGQLQRAAARIVQASERWIEPLLPTHEEPPVEARVSDPARGFNSALQLYASTEGRAELADTASHASFAMRGPYHAISFALAQARQALQTNASWSLEERGMLRNQLAPLEALSPPLEVELVLEPAPEGSVGLHLHAPAAATDAELLSRYQVWWTDAGLRCALRREASGSSCDAAEFKLDASRAEVRREQSDVFIRGLRFPQPRSWNVDRSLERARGRLYVMRSEPDGSLHALVSAALRSGGGVRELGFMNAGLGDQLLALLGHVPPPESCAHCVPRSVCEETRCEDGRCLRNPVSNPRSCGRQAVCMDGVCSKPGCGDGVRSENTTDVPYEACDDGNLSTGDGCSAQCELEPRRIEAAIAEAHPSGPAPAIGVDGLGQSLLVYTADPLQGDQSSIRSVRFDAFGVRREGSAVLEANLPRGYAAEPNVVGLRDGGFVVVQARTGANGQSGASFRLVDVSGGAGPVIFVAQSSSVQTNVRVAPQGDGFVVAWRERSALDSTARIRAAHFDRAGRLVYGPLDVSVHADSIEPANPSLAASHDQVLVVWSEHSTTTGVPLGVRGHRLGSGGESIDSGAFSIVTGDASAPSATALQTGDYLVAWTDRRGDSSGDIWIRRVRRFGHSVEGLPTEAVVATVAAEQLPVIAAGAGDGFVLGFQTGSTLARAALLAPGANVDSTLLAQERLANAGYRDLSLSRAPRGVWTVWSQAASQGRDLYLLQLPVATAVSE